MAQRRTNPTARARLSPSEGETRSAQLQGRMHNSVVRGSCHICSGTGLTRATSAPGLGVLQRLVRARACADSAAPLCCAAGNGSTCATRGTERAVESPPAQHSVAHAAQHTCSVLPYTHTFGCQRSAQWWMRAHRRASHAVLHTWSQRESRSHLIQLMYVYVCQLLGVPSQW
jgi:hypothetical protein